MCAVWYWWKAKSRSTCVFLVFNSCKYMTEFIVVALRTWKFIKSDVLICYFTFALSNSNVAFYVVVIIFFVEIFLVNLNLYFKFPTNIWYTYFDVLFWKIKERLIIGGKLHYIDFSSWFMFWWMCYNVLVVVSCVLTYLVYVIISGFHQLQNT